ncbi:MAG: hypothetical protein OQL19_17270 [Gammaproteobacteria bacterium]|nr:hypothetical protein [Gammaproteobacteria bacterium]
MKYKLLKSAAISALICSSASAVAIEKVYDESSLQIAINNANYDSSINKIVFVKNAKIILTSPIIYNGTQSLKLLGNNATIDGSSAGSFELDENLTATTDDGTLIFNTSANLSIHKLNIVNSASRGIVVNIPASSDNDEIDINLHRVHISDSALYGLHIDDNANEFDDGSIGSDMGIDLNISRSSFTGNGTGAIDFDGIRVDERANGNIVAVITHTHIDGNGGDGIELDEAGEGDVEATMIHVSLNGNGFYNEEDLDDGFDIDEADEGNIEVRLVDVEVNNNKDEGLDFDEAGDGDIEIKLKRITAHNNSDEGIKLDEEDAGNIEASLKKIQVTNSGDDGIQFTELGEGQIKAYLKKVISDNNKKYGIKMEQWVVEDEVIVIEEPGKLITKKVSLMDNINGDDIKLNNIILKAK